MAKYFPCRVSPYSVLFFGISPARFQQPHKKPNTLISTDFFRGCQVFREDSGILEGSEPEKTIEHGITLLEEYFTSSYASV